MSAVETKLSTSCSWIYLKLKSLIGAKSTGLGGSLKSSENGRELKIGGTLKQACDNHYTF